MKALQEELDEENNADNRPVANHPAESKDRPKEETVTRRSASETKLAVSERQDKAPLSRAISEGNLSPKAKRNWSNAFRKKSKDSSDTDSTDVSVSFDDENGVTGVRLHADRH